MRENTAYQPPRERDLGVPLDPGDEGVVEEEVGDGEAGLERVGVGGEEERALEIRLERGGARKVNELQRVFLRLAACPSSRINTLYNRSANRNKNLVNRNRSHDFKTYFSRGIFAVVSM